jgi:hypothetical protein
MPVFTTTLIIPFVLSAVQANQGITIKKSNLGIILVPTA